MIKEWQIDPESGEPAIADLKRLVTEKTALVCFTLCSNFIGTIHDYAAVAEFAHSVDALAIGDGASFAPTGSSLSTPTAWTSTAMMTLPGRVRMILSLIRNTPLGFLANTTNQKACMYVRDIWNEGFCQWTSHKMVLLLAWNYSGIFFLEKKACF